MATTTATPAGAGAAEESSPFQDLTKWDDAPLPPVGVEDPQASSEGVASMLDSPFCSSLIAPGLMEQLSQSIARASTGGGGADAPDSGGVASSTQAGAAATAAAAADAPARTAAADSASGAGAGAAGKGGSDAGRLQGVANILESPFSRCLDDEVKHLKLGEGAGSGSKSTGAA